ncbi:MAG: hypothetical protein VKN72_13580 [Nostocales cyanobacterium 94392]|nr:hypothetical protein [Nostocales cyanobacterium 94392]
MKGRETWTLITQISLTSVVTGLCVFQLAMNPNNPNIALYWGGLSGIVGYWLPSPMNLKEEEHFANGNLDMGSDVK